MLPWRRHCGSNVLVILAPRHLHRCEAILALCKHRRVALRSRGDDLGGCELYLADTYGEMTRWYTACDVAIIGGSFLPHGGQNPIEAMAIGVPAVVGPYMDNYDSLVSDAVADGALINATSAQDAMATVRRLLRAPERREKIGRRAQQFCANRRGALATHQALCLTL